jgi:membrane-associated phospholipid phosphatase
LDVNGARRFLAIVLLVGPTLGRAGPGDLKVNFRRDLAVTAGAAAAAYGLGAVGTEHCRICASGSLDSGAREALKLRSPIALQDARRASNYLASYALPAGAIAASGFVSLRDGSRREFLEDMLVLAEAAAIAADVNAFAKGFVGRPRPGDAGVDGAPSGRSFYSSHTSRAFTLAVAAGTISSIRGRESAPWVWGAGLTLAAGVGYLRIASDAHWLTDVGAGAAVGSAVGFAVPWFLHRRHRRTGRRVEVTPAPGGLALSF